MYFFKNSSVKPEFTAKGIQSAAEKLSVIKMDAQERLAYDSYMLDLSYESSMLDTRFIEGEAVGIEKGKIEGKIEIGKTLKTKGFSYSEITEITGLSLDELEKL